MKQLLAMGLFCGDFETAEAPLLVELLDSVQHVRRSQSAPKVKSLVEMWEKKPRVDFFMACVCVDLQLAFFSCELLIFSFLL